MIDYSIYKFSDHVNQELKKLNINYVFQPIYDADGNIFAHEALMRPEGYNIMDFISLYESRNELHILELATLFGAFQEYQRRGLDSALCINSFPSELLTDWEVKVFKDAFPEVSCQGIIELLEYPAYEINQWQKKKMQLDIVNIPFALDDFGSGSSTLDAVSTYGPQIVKLDINMISNIDKDPAKQQEVSALVDLFHKDNRVVVGEGIETKGEYDYLASIGVDYFQGFYLSVPA